MKLDPNGTRKDIPASKFWEIIHNGIAHPLLIIGFYSRPVVWFHDWTSYRAWPEGYEAPPRSERNE